MRVAVLLALFVATVAGLPQQRITGGTEADISSFPYAAALLRWNEQTVSYGQQCAGAIVNNRSILTSNNCVEKDPANYWRARLGSSLANSGGVIYIIGSFIPYPDFNSINSDNDLVLLRTASMIFYQPNIARISLAGSGYILDDNTDVTVVGWGAVRYEGERSNQLLKGEIKTINQNVCRENYNEISMEVTINMQCAGILEGGADFCEGDIGAPLVHSNTLVGIASWRTPICGRARFPGVYTRIHRYASWIAAHV